MSSVLDTINKYRVVAIARQIPADCIVPMAKALRAGGIRLLEITFDQSSMNRLNETTRAISAVREAMGEEMVVGAGTVLTTGEARAAVDAGAQFLLSATVDRFVIEKGKELGAVMIPGAMTPSEIFQAFEWGADIVKLFPAGLLGPDYLRTLRGPLPHIPLMAVGGVDEKNTASFIRAGARAVGVGGSLMRASYVREGKLEELSDLASVYAAAVLEG